MMRRYDAVHGRPPAPRLMPPEPEIPSAAAQDRRSSSSCRAAEKVRTKFPDTPGVYLFQDKLGRVIYVGKAKNLKARAGSYFLKAAADDSPHRQLVLEAYDIDFLEAESEVDALLMEARLVKDMQPKFNRDLKDDKSFPYLQITTHEDFPARRDHPRAAHQRREALRPVRQRRQPPRRPAGAAADLQVPHLLARHRRERRALAVVPARACWRRSTSAPRRATCGSRKEEYRRDIAPAAQVPRRRRKPLLAEMRAEMQEAAEALRFEQAARLRDEIQMLETLDDRGDLDKHEQPEVFYLDPEEGPRRAAEGAQAAEAAADDRRRRHRPPRRQRDGGQPRAVHRRPAVQARLPPLPDSRGRRASTTTRASTKWSPAASAGSTTRAKCSPTSC